MYSRLAGYEDTNDAERLSVDPAMRQVIGGRARDRQAASTSQMGRFETEILTTRKNLKSLMDLPGMWIDRVAQQRSLDKLILDLDSSVSETYGRQEGSAYNGHFVCNCYHPLFCFNHLGDLERVLLRNGNVASADNWRSVLEPVVARYRDLKISKYFRGDAAFAIPELYSFLDGPVKSRVAENVQGCPPEKFHPLKFDCYPMMISRHEASSGHGRQRVTRHG